MSLPPDLPGRPAYDSLSAQTVHDLRAPLAVIKGQTQLAKRWLRRNDVPDAEIVLQRLAAIDTMVMRLTAALEALHERSSLDAATDDHRPG